MLWSIGVEEQFYLIYPFVILLVLRHARARVWIVVSVLFAAWCFRGWFASLVATPPSLGSAGGMYYATLSYADVLLAGAVAGWLAAHPASLNALGWLKRGWFGAVVVVASLAVGLLWETNLWYPYTPASIVIYTLLGFLFASFLLWTFVRPDHRLVQGLTWRPLRALGSLSYGLYMWHVVSNTCVAAVLARWGAHSYLYSSPWAHLACSVLAAIAFALASHWLIERPFLKLLARYRPYPSAPDQRLLVPLPALIAAAQDYAAPHVARRAWLAVLATYVVLYAILLFRTDGYPYVLDNNESYSSWWHARSLYVNGVAQTKGLTDEVFSTHPAASPYIHSHQGNFPRLFTFVLYAVGLRSIAAQIWITTFTVGLAALYFAFRFLSRLGNPLYAALTCLVLMTDYLFFTQWQVSLYNVWHGFFFFSSLFCVQSLGTTPHRGRWFVLALLNFAALFYWEYVFTAFVTALCGLYALVLYWRRFRLVWLAAAAGAAGAALAAGLLLAQLTAYMGWANVMEDVRLTLTARNAAADPVLLDRVSTFYR